MRRREFIALMGASVTWPFAAMAQEPGRIYRLGVLLLLPRDAPLALAFSDKLRRGGFIEGQNLTIEWRVFGQHFDLLPQYARELVQARVDAIITAGDEAIRSRRRRRRYGASRALPGSSRVLLPVARYLWSAGSNHINSGQRGRCRQPISQLPNATFGVASPGKLPSVRME
jgi:hypothetical protein